MHSPKRNSSLSALFVALISVALISFWTGSSEPPPALGLTKPKDILLAASILESSNLLYQFDLSDGKLRSHLRDEALTDPRFVEFRTVPQPKGEPPPLWELARVEEERLAGKVAGVLEQAFEPKLDFVCYVRFRVSAKETNSSSYSSAPSLGCHEMPPRKPSKYPPFKVEGLSILLVLDARDITKEELEKLEGFISRAVGIDTTRGDKATVLPLSPSDKWHEVYDWAVLKQALT